MVNKVKIGDTIYPINTDFKVALKCDEIAQDESINSVEKTMSIIYLLFGDKGLDDTANHSELMRLAIKYLNKEKETEKGANEPNMDYKQDEGYIYASFLSEYRLNLEEIEMHWWRFLDLMNGLSSEAVINRVREIRDFDLSEITDSAERQKIIDMKESVKLEKRISKEKQEAMDKFKRLIGKG